MILPQSSLILVSYLVANNHRANWTKSEALLLDAASCGYTKQHSLLHDISLLQLSGIKKVSEPRMLADNLENKSLAISLYDRCSSMHDDISGRNLNRLLKCIEIYSVPIPRSIQGSQIDLRGGKIICITNP